MLALLGTAIGAAAAWAFGGVIQTTLHDVQPTDRRVFVGTATAVLGVALAAPAWRRGRRHE